MIGVSCQKATVDQIREEYSLEDVQFRTFCRTRVICQFRAVRLLHR